MPWFETITDLKVGAERVRARRYGVIETRGGRLAAIHLRPWPTLFCRRDVLLTSDDYHATGDADRCRLYYNEPRTAPGFLALKYVESTAGTSYATFRAALAVLDVIAELKASDALVCDAANSRISDRLLARMGWEPHAPARWRRNHIKRFYGNYPPRPAWLAAAGDA